ncbi:cation-translocating P-type ATPase [Lactococcus garvieae]|uniref:cation-translocating P-type ATPase n=1 Tax=Lactococcus garvieae TaxID=1363 RepID=UPI0009BCAFC6|nr:HAD-IC family P-type ATPase [Lactococcus garvieae]
MNYWHNLKIKDILAEFSPGIITPEARKAYQKQYGKNILSAAKKTSKWKKFFSYFHDALMYILIIASLIKLMTGNFIEGIIVLLVVVLNAAIGYYQESKADESLSSITKLLSSKATIESGAGKVTINSEELIPGDYVYISPGDVLPADLRIISANNLMIDESILTGEAEAIQKMDAILDIETVLAERTNMAYSGTQVQSGIGKGIVVSIGSETEIGKISKSLETIELKETPLLKKVNEMNHSIFKGIGILIFLLGCISYFIYGMNIMYIASAIIALIVSSIPEGLPSILTIILSSGVKNMSKQNAIVKGLPTVETLGSMTVICSDKTGTLTKNEMELTHLFTNNQIIDISDTKVEELYSNKLLAEIMQSCQQTQSITDTNGPTTGNPTELALLKWTNHMGVEQVESLETLPFDSKYKYMATSHKNGDKKRIYVKGAPDVLLEKSIASYSNDKVNKLDLLQWQQSNSSLASKGQRVLAFAYKDIDYDTILNHDEINNLVIVGLAGIIDPPKQSAIEAVRDAIHAGVRVVMITGDHPETAKAIGNKLGIKNSKEVITGSELENLSPKQWEPVVRKTNIFARTTPEHKLQIVTYLQNQGEIVGMTGDGVNDAPALKKADVGIAMGIKGSDVSKQAADMILIDDNFATIGKAIREGRRIFDNLKKTILFYLPTCVAQGLLLITSMLSNNPLPLTTVQILWLNLVASITLSYALGFEPAHKMIMNRPPRNINEKIISKYTLFRIIYVGVLLTVFGLLTMSLFSNESIRQTVLINAMVLGQAFYMINCREILDSSFNNRLRNNKALLYSLLVMGLLQLGMIYFYPMQKLIQTSSLNSIELLLSLLPGVVLFILVEFEKFLTKKVFNKDFL